MDNRVIAAAKYNAAFAMDVLLLGAELVGSSQDSPTGGTLIVDALLKAWEKVQQGETARQRKLRTYGWRHFASDLSSYVLLNEGVNPDSGVPISEWGKVLVPAFVAAKLRRAAPVVARTAEERTISAGRLGIMDEKELYEHFLIEATADFLRTQGLQVEMSREWDNPNAPLDYRGNVDGVPWAFELTRLRQDPKSGYHRKIGHPKERKSLDEQLRAFSEEPMPKVPSGPEVLQRNLKQAIEHGRKASKTKTLMRAKYCLVVHNQQFTNPEDWERIAFPEPGELDAVIFLHEQMIPPGQVWEVIPPDAFARNVESSTVEDLERIAFAPYRSGVDPEPDFLDIDLGFFFES